ncbi:MAG: AAA family ATPase [Kiritimatiellia bacterium]|jgi:CO dehydrogenase maturation factor|nr:AAA family ATPase [Kiritimatiellia bacterium]MDP6631653.1 AAA family ATPase [Kiritimatiellia bacterium]MDP6810751.1 AAA family ATPase [Kiritimatiellia bacterium]MDP7022626.1 AAA family ATPase [Kiritimatiellia bacterium]
MKLAVTGKGGVGKTTLSALLARALHHQGHSVFCIDADPDSNLAATLGCAEWERIRPLVDLKALIEERTGVKPGTTGGMFRLNPEVSDIPASYGVDIDGVRVLVAGAVKKGGSGCYCPENALLHALISHVLLDPGSALVLDMEAGVEHLGRGTVSNVDALLVVVNPGRRSIETALRIRRMAADIGLEQVAVVANRVRTPADEAFIRDALPNLPVLGVLPEDETLLAADCTGQGVPTAEGATGQAISALLTELSRLVN